MHFSDIRFGWEQWGWRPCQAPAWPSCAPASSYKVLWEILASYCRAFIIKIYINICLVVFFQEKWYFSFYPHLQGSIKSLQICLHVGLKKKYFRLDMKMNIFGKYCVPLKYSSSCQAPSLEIMRSCTIVERKRETVRAEGQRAEWWNNAEMERREESLIKTWFTEVSFWQELILNCVPGFDKPAEGI